MEVVRVVLEKMSGEVLELRDVLRSTRISELKERIALLASKPSEIQAYPICQSLTLRGEVLEDTKTLGSLSEKGDLHLTLLFSIDLVLAALRDGSSRSTAVDILLNTGARGGRLIEAFGACLEETPRPQVTDEMLALLASLPSSDSSNELMELLLVCLEHPSWPVREVAIEAIQRIEHEQKEVKLLQKLKRLLGDLEQEDVDREYSSCMACMEAYGEIASGGEDVLDVLQQALDMLRGGNPHHFGPLASLEIVLGAIGHWPWEVDSEKSKGLRRRVVEVYCHLSHLVMYIDHRGLPGRRRLDWSTLMLPLARRLMRGRALAPKALKSLLSHLVSSNFSFQDETTSRNRLAPKARDRALRELVSSTKGDLTEVVALLEHPYDTVKAAAVYILARTAVESTLDLIQKPLMTCPQDVCSALADACAAGPVAVSEELVAALFSLSESMDFFIRFSAMKALWALGERPPTEAWIRGTSFEAEAALEMLPDHQHDLICGGLRHSDAFVRLAAIRRLLKLHGLPQWLEELDLKKGATNCVKYVAPTANLEGGDKTIRALDLSAEDSPEVIKAALGLLAGLARSSKQAAVEALYRLQESRRRLPQALAMAVLKDLQEPFKKKLRVASWRSSVLKAEEDGSWNAWNFGAHARP